jgi:predicted N-acetyltransferase YhbS
MSTEPVYRSMLAEEKPQLLDLWLKVWPGEQNEEYFRRYFYGDVEWLPYYTQVAELDGKIVSSVHICKRQVWCSGALLTMGGIANVATLPEYQGRGINSQCMAKAIHVMEADAMDFSLLFTGIPDYYRKYGYRDLSRRRLALTADSEKTAAALQSLETKGCKIGEASATQMPRIRQLYCEFNRGRSITVDRWDAYWRDWMRIDAAVPPSTLITAVDAAGETCGYVLTGTFSSAIPYQASDVGIRVLEMAWDVQMPAEMQQAIAAGLLAKAARNIGAANTELILECALTPEVITACSGLAASDDPDRSPLTFSESGSAMVKLLRPMHLMKNLCILWSEKWFLAGRPAGAIEIAFDDLALTLDAHGPVLNITENSGTPGALKLAQEQLMSLLMGSGADTVGPTAGDNAQLLAALFTDSGTVYYGKDGF